MYRVYFQNIEDGPKDFLDEFLTLEEAKQYRAECIERDGWTEDDYECDQLVIEGPINN